MYRRSKQILTTGFFLLIGLCLNAQERLLVYYQAEQDSRFVQETLPKVKAFAETESLDLIISDQLEAGLPEEITTTPAIIFQNALGDAIYAGRHTEFSSIRNFVRIARISKQSDLPLEKTDLWVQQNGRTQIAIALKITPLVGPNINDFSAKDLNQKIKAGLSQGLTNYTKQKQAALKRTDRLFYLDIHPYLDATGQLHLSTAIFSAFSCIDPVAEQFDQALKGAWDEAASLSQLIGHQTSKSIENILANSTIGDAYSPIPANIPVVSLADLGYPAPKAGAVSPTLTALPDFALPKIWKMTGPINAKVPLIQFHFAAPLERYAGEVRQASGQLSLDQQGQIESGAFVVAVNSLTMGMESFDAKVLKSYLKAKKYPESSFQFQQVRLNTPLAWGQQTQATITGALIMLGKTREATMNANLVPSVNEQGQAILIVQGNFQLNITDLFGIKGPDGPDPARKTLVFNLSFLMEAAEQK